VRGKCATAAFYAYELSVYNPTPIWLNRPFVKHRIRLRVSPLAELYFLMVNVLFIGGTGLISGECATLALRRGIRLHLLTRGRRALELPAGVPPPQQIQADITDPAATERALAGRTFDCVVNFIAFKPAEVERDIRLFAGMTANTF